MRPKSLVSPSLRRSNAALAAAAVAATALAASAQSTTTRLSISSSSIQANGASFLPAFSSDGRYVSFHSAATNLVPGDSNSSSDVFLRDRVIGTTTRVSLGPGGAQGNANSGWNGTSPVASSVATDGTFVAFCSAAANLVAGDTNGAVDVFVRDLSGGTTSRVSVSSGGAQATGASRASSISGDGLLVAFASLANNLVAGDNGQEDVFLRDRAAGTTVLVSLSSTGVKGSADSNGPAISTDGRYVAFQSLAPNLFVPDGNFDFDIFVRDLQTGTTARASLTSTGGDALGSSQSPAISADGRYVAFYSTAANLVPGDVNGFADVFVRDLQALTTVLVSADTSGAQANFDCDRPALSGDGRFCAFWSRATNLVSNDQNGTWDVFVRDLVLPATTRASLTQSGGEANGASNAPSISADGRYVAFDSPATNLVPLDNNGVSDVFLRDRTGLPPSTYCTPKPNSLACQPLIGFVGLPSVQVPSGFLVQAASTLNNKFGLLFYSTSGPNAAIFQGGYLCCQLPIVRTPLQGSGGNPPPDDCSGSFSFDFNAHIAAGSDPALVLGATVWSQYWSRDPGDPFTTSLSDALRFTIAD